MEKYIEEALAVSHIRSSTSPAAAGFFFVGKKDGSLRLCIDYRGLNAITVRYPYPLPLEGDEWKTAFQTTHGHYEYLVMPFGLTNAPVVFQSLINEVFQDILGKLQQNHLYIKPEKCEFHRTTITFLGYVISRQGVEMYLTKVRAVTEWPNPTMTKELQRFLELGNFYRRFIRNYSSVAGPLTSLLRGKPRRLSWSDQAQVAFSKDSFTMAPILRHPDPDLPFVVEVDASSCGIGAMLSQRHGVPGKLHPCRAGGMATCHPFLVLTDHRNFEYLHSAKHLNPRQARWVLFFTQFEFPVTYCPGTKNSKADALTRQLEAWSEPPQPDLIPPAATILAPVRWSLMYLRPVSGQAPAPGGIAGAPTYTTTPMVSPVCGLSHMMVVVD
ncbi:hypothetical protein QTP86_026365 [Hemibagrus guttatus]|nr:hypothetical protein QTP86_026365 [Hemibagrus guttatus]